MADLEIRDLSVEFTSGEYTVRPINNFSVSAYSGELVVLLGPSGSGKTTLLSCLAGILTPTSGSITVAGTDIGALRGDELTEYRRRTVGIVFQAFNLIPSLTALENAAAPLLVAGTKRKAALAHATKLLERVGLGDRLQHKPAHMSGGQQQRVAIARAMAHDPPLLIADEPTAHLDFIQVEGVLSLLRDLASPGRLVVVATHDERFVPLADRTIELVPRAAPSRPPEHLVLEMAQVLFRQGDRSDFIYVLEAGEIEIYRERTDGTEEPLAILEAGQYFGELGPMLGLPRSASARALTRSEVTGYSLRDFRDMAAREPRFAKFLRTAKGLTAQDGADPSVKI